MEEWPPMWRVAVHVLNKQSWTADKGCFSCWGGGGFGEVLTTPFRKNVLC